MKFPVCHCLPTSLLTRESYDELVCRVVSEGHVNMIAHLDYALVTAWDYIGITEYGNLEVFDKPWSFLEVNRWMNYRDIEDENYPNILTKQDLEEYLK